MNINGTRDILNLLTMPWPEFSATVQPRAKEMHRTVNGNTVTVTALLGYDNICRNQCLYCGMRAGCTGLNRFRLSLDDVQKTGETAWAMGLRRLFLISGEDPGFPFQDIVSMVEQLKKRGFFLSLGAGEFTEDEYRRLAAVGLDEYVLKFETSDEAFFNRLKPSTTFEKRMKAIEAVRKTGMKLGSGNIIGLPHQTLEQLADDIILMKKLDISWAPVIPYMPVPGTPLAEEGGRGSLEWLLKEISILRLILPHIRITAQQPGETIKNGLADEQGNLNALAAGADNLFVDMLPSELMRDFNVINNRIVAGIENVDRLIAAAGMTRRQ
jgi:biotin synthase